MSALSLNLISVCVQAEEAKQAGSWSEASLLRLQWGCKWQRANVPEGKNKAEQCLLKGCSSFCLESKRDVMSPHITTLLITTFILTTHPIFTRFLTLLSQCQWTKGVVMAFSGSSIVNRQLLCTLAMNTWSTLHLHWQILICYFTPYH